MADKPMADKPMDARKVTTPVGAILGLLTVRGLLPPDKRDALAYATGAGVGGGAGYLAGSYYNPYGESIKASIKDTFSPANRPIDALRRKLKTLNARLDADPSGESSEEGRQDMIDLWGQNEFRPGVGEDAVQIDPSASHKAFPSSKGDRRTLKRNIESNYSNLSAERARQRGNISGAADAAERSKRYKENYVPPEEKSVFRPLAAAGRFLLEKTRDLPFIP